MTNEIFSDTKVRLVAEHVDLIPRVSFLTEKMGGPLLRAAKVRGVDKLNRYGRSNMDTF
jgi:hypothetical protein